MALRPFNSIQGFSVGESPKIDVVYANGDVSAVNFTASGISNLGPVSNVFITGGLPGQVITTDGNGNLTFSASSSNNAAPMPYLIEAGLSYIVQNNFQGLFSYPITIDGELDVEGVLIEVGTALDAQDTQVLYDNQSVISGNSGFTFNRVSGNLNLPGNLNVTGNILPTSNNAVSLGSPTNRFSNVYLSGNTIVLGTSTISTDILGDLVLTSGTGAVLAVAGNSDISTLQNGNSNISINANSTVTISSNGIANIFSVSPNLVTVVGNIETTGILTDNYYHANGVPVDFGGASGQNTWIQYSDGKDLASSANLTYNNSTQLLTVNGNVSSNNITANYLVSTSGCVTIGTGAIAVINNTGGIFNSTVSNINIGLAANIYMGSATGTVTTRNDLISNGNITTNQTVIANNVEVGDLYSKRNPITVTGSNTVVDTFGTSVFRSAKYTIKAQSDLGYQALEVLLVHDSINTFITVYASLSTAPLGAETVLITAEIASGNVNLLATPYSSNTTVNLMGTYVPD
jgi:hypothetical protein